MRLPHQDGAIARRSGSTANPKRSSSSCRSRSRCKTPRRRSNPSRLRMEKNRTWIWARFLTLDPRLTCDRRAEGVAMRIAANVVRGKMGSGAGHKSHNLRGGRTYCKGVASCDGADRCRAPDGCGQRAIRECPMTAAVMCRTGKAVDVVDRDADLGAGGLTPFDTSVFPNGSHVFWSAFHCEVRLSSNFVPGLKEAVRPPNKDLRLKPVYHSANRHLGDWIGWGRRAAAMGSCRWRIVNRPSGSQ